MTCIIALKYQEKIVIGSESLWTSDEKRDYNLINKTKLFKFKDYVVGICNLFSVTHAITTLQNNKNYVRKLKLETVEQVKNFARDIFKTLKDHLEESPSGSIDTQVPGAAKENYGSLLIATPKDIYVVDTYLGVYKKDKFAVIGSGEDEAVGALSAYYSFLPNPDENGYSSCPFGWEFEDIYSTSITPSKINHDTLESIVRSTLEIVCGIVSSCGGNFEILPVKVTPQKRKVRRKR